MTLAILLGHQGSYVFYVLLILGAYISTGGIAYYHRWGCLLSYLTIPLANKLFEVTFDPFRPFITTFDDFLDGRGSGRVLRCE